MQIVVLALKRLILTSERRVEHAFAGRNTQHWMSGNQIVTVLILFLGGEM